MPATGPNSQGLGRGKPPRQSRADDSADDGRPGGRARSRAFYVFGENLANTEPDIRKVEHCLASAEFLVCQDIFPTETTRFAHVILPAAAWSENDGTFTNSERRVSRVRTASPPPGQAKPNWWIFKEIAKRMGQEWAVRQRPGDLGQRGLRAGPAAVPASNITGWKATACSGPAPMKPCGHLLPAQGRPVSPAAWGSSPRWTGPRRPRLPTRNIPLC